MRIAKEFILREIAGECVLVPTGDTTREYNGLLNKFNPVGPLVTHEISSRAKDKKRKKKAQTWS